MAERSIAARLGISALNILGPGLGLLRVSEARRGFAFLAAPVFVLLAFTLAFALLPTMTLAGGIAVFAAAIAMALAILGGSVWLTWRASRERPARLPLYARWYVLVVIIIISGLASDLAIELAHSYYKPFYLPSDSMAPTLSRSDKIIADMRARQRPAMGAIVLVRTPDAIYVKRVAALPGDSIAMRAGVPIINGKAALQRNEGKIDVSGSDGMESGILFTEQFPGEASPHHIVKIEQSALDDMPTTVVPAGHIFLLGDNRDRSADSRVSPENMGLGMVSEARVIGRPLFIHWSADRSRIGRDVSH